MISLVSLSQSEAFNISLSKHKHKTLAHMFVGGRRHKKIEKIAGGLTK